MFAFSHSLIIFVHLRYSVRDRENQKVDEELERESLGVSANG